jgi:micrococcal nuclease
MMATRSQRSVGSRKHTSESGCPAIDAPELAQAWGPPSQRFASNLLLNHEVELRPIEKDRYGRTVAQVTLDDNRDLARVMVEAGMAFHYERYSVDPVALADLEQQAHAENRGLWGFGGEMRPEDFRNQPHSRTTSRKKR